MRHAVAALIVADDAVVGRELCPPVTPDWAGPFEVQMGQPVGGLDERWSAADAGVGQADTVIGGAVTNLLPRAQHVRHSRRGGLPGALDGPGETIAHPRHGLDILLHGRAADQGLAEHRYGVSEVVLLDRRAGPDGIEQLLFRD